jgi:mitotic spindle assembly checkpoint protein MAD2
VDGKIENQVSSKSLVKVQKEIQSVLRQTSGTISFLPTLPDECSFEVHVLTTPGTPTPPGWRKCEKVRIRNSEDFVMQSFSTGLQKVRTSVNHKII